jgi:transcription initiation factor IIE alpha subunit
MEKREMFESKTSTNDHNHDQNDNARQSGPTTIWIVKCRKMKTQIVKQVNHILEQMKMMVTMQIHHQGLTCGRTKGWTS